MDESWLAARFEEQRPRLQAVAYRMLGSLTEADDAVQDTWLRLSGTEADEIDNLGGWLTTVVARICLNRLRSRSTRREQALTSHLPDPLITREGLSAPEDEAVLADSVSLALLVVLETLSPAERLAFVLHDLFQLPFEEIAPMLGRSEAATRQIASRARKRLKAAEVKPPQSTPAKQREVVDAFFAAARGGNFDDLVALLDPEVVLRVDSGPRRRAAPAVLRGAPAVARQAKLGANPAAVLHPVLTNGGAGVVITVGDRPLALMSFTVVGEKISEIDVIAEPERVRRLTAGVLQD